VHVLNGVATIAAILASTQAASAQASLTPDELKGALALGQQCLAPIARVTNHDGDFEIFIESPQGRAALVTATAIMMQQPLDSAHVRRAMEPGYRVWLQRKRNDWRPLSVTSLSIRSRGREVKPSSMRSGRFVIGSVPSHGIVPELRTRFPEYVFADLPVTDFEVVVVTPSEKQGYRVTASDRQAVMRVCN
jgi:hypothetical protein